MIESTSTTSSSSSDQYESSINNNFTSSNSIVPYSQRNISDIFNKILKLRESENKPPLTLMISPSQMALLKNETLNKSEYFKALKEFNKNKNPEKKLENSLLSSIRLSSEEINFSLLQFIDDLFSSNTPLDLINEENFISLLETADYHQMEKLETLCLDWFANEFNRSYQTKVGISDLLLELIFNYPSIQKKLTELLSPNHLKIYDPIEGHPKVFINCFKTYVSLYKNITSFKKESHPIESNKVLENLINAIENQITIAITLCLTTSARKYKSEIAENIKIILNSLSLTLNTYKHEKCPLPCYKTRSRDFINLIEIIELLEVKTLFYSDRHLNESFFIKLSKVENLVVKFDYYGHHYPLFSPNLKSLDLTTCVSQYTSVKKILQNSPNLHTLTLCSKITDSLEEVIEILRDSTPLKWINLEGCRIGDSVLNSTFKGEPQQVIPLLEDLIRPLA